MSSAQRVLILLGALLLVHTLALPKSLASDELVPTNGMPNAFLYGRAVAISGDTAIVGDSGAAYVFVRIGGTWTQEARLSVDMVGFGVSVALLGDRAFVGATGPASDFSGPGSGAVYVFLRSGTTWTQEAELTPDAANLYNFFGNCLSVSNQTLLVGAMRDRQLAGSAFVFTRDGTTWTQEAQLTVGVAGSSSERFGFSCALSQDLALIGTRRSAAHVFRRSGTSWTFESTLTPSDNSYFPVFGQNVALSGSTALVGAFLRDQGLALGGPGAVFVYERQALSWSEQTILKLGPGSNDYFGVAVAILENRAIIGSQVSAAHSFVRNDATWSLEGALIGPDDDQFGNDVALSTDTVVVGATGSAFVFEACDAGTWSCYAPPDAGPPVDAGIGSPDSGTSAGPDAGLSVGPDAADSDDESSQGCGCSATPLPESNLAWALLLALVLARGRPNKVRTRARR